MVDVGKIGSTSEKAANALDVALNYTSGKLRGRSVVIAGGAEQSPQQAQFPTKKRARCAMATDT